MFKHIFIFLLLFMTLGLNGSLIANNNSLIAERGMGGDRGDFHRNDSNRDNFNRDDFNRGDLNRGDFNRGDEGAAYGAAYGAAAGSSNANANSGSIPVNPNALEQNMLYYGGVRNMEQGQ